MGQHAGARHDVQLACVLGVWQATAAQDIVGKIVGIFCAPTALKGSDCETWGLSL